MPHLIRHFLERKAKELNLPTKQFATDALDLLLARHWPGNVCELENVIERALVLSPDDLLTVADLRHTLAGPPPPAPRHATLGSPRQPVNARSLNDAVHELEQHLIVAALNEAGFNQSRGGDPGHHATHPEA